MSAKKRKKGGTFITGVDIGTSKICVVVCELTEDGIDILSISTTPSAGIRKGIVVNQEAATAAIRDALASARQMSGVAVREAILSITGQHLMTQVSSASVPVVGRTIAQADIEKAIDASGNIALPAGRDIIHVLPTDFIVDGSMGIKDPIGMPGSKIEARVNIITSGSEPLSRIIMSCEKAALNVNEFVIHSIASAESVLTYDERDMGTALADVGAGTTDIALFRDGWVHHTSVIGIGGNHFTNDLCVGLSIPFSEAERIKKQYGTLAGMNWQPDTADLEIDVVGADGVVKKISGRAVGEILQCRAEELLNLIRAEIKRLEGRDAITGVVFTGGAVMLPSFERMAETVLAMPVRIGKPDLAPRHMYQSAPSLPFGTGAGDDYNGPEFAAAIGLVLYAVGSEPEAERHEGDGILTRMTGFFRNMIGRDR